MSSSDKRKPPPTTRTRHANLEHDDDNDNGPPIPEQPQPTRRRTERIPEQHTEFLLSALEEMRDWIETHVLPIGQVLTTEHLESFLERASRVE